MPMDSGNAAEMRLAAGQAARIQAPANVQKRDKDPAVADGDGFQPFGSDGLTFADVLDVINPLQHIPLVSSVYRQLTGDEIDPVPRVAGGALFGGIIGAAVSAFNVIVKELTGRDTGEHMLALFSGGDEEVPESGSRIAWNGDRVAPGHGVAAPPGQTITWNTPRVLPQSRPQPELANAPAQMEESSSTLSPDSGRRADVFAAVRYGRGGPGRQAALNQAASLGASAADGGWFSATMLAALARYEHGAELALPSKPARVDILN